MGLKAGGLLVIGDHRISGRNISYPSNSGIDVVRYDDGH